MKKSDLGSRRRSILEQYLPVGYFAVSMALVATLLPTALRPPQDNPTTSAEFAPDAPPEDNPESILGNLAQGRTGTAGGGQGGGAGTVEEGPQVTPTPPPEQQKPRHCPWGGYGDPPRQVQSVYAAPCAPAFSGDNGGSTYKNVTRDEVRVAAILPQAAPASAIAPSYEGPVPTEPQDEETPQDRTWRVYQTYFNKAYQFWGRYLRFVVVKPNSNGAAQQRAAVAEADERYRSLGLMNAKPNSFDEAVRRGLITFGGYNAPVDAYGHGRPYAWGFFIDATRLLRLDAEYVCKKLHGKRASFAGDPTLAGESRTFGLLTLESTGNEGAEERGQLFRRLLKEECGVEVAAEASSALSDGDTATRVGDASTAMARFRSEGVTTIINISDFITTQQMTTQADSHGYFPEWFIGATNAMDNPVWARDSYSQQQWENAFGVTALEIPRRDQERDWYRAYKRIDPSNNPHRGVATNIFHYMMVFANGFQATGPDVSPTNFEAGLFELGHREPDPKWSVGGGYGPGDFTFPDYVAEIWWDPEAQDPNGDNGAYRFTHDGRRFTFDEFTSDTSQLFEKGITSP